MLLRVFLVSALVAICTAGNRFEVNFNNYGGMGGGDYNGGGRCPTRPPPTEEPEEEEETCALESYRYGAFAGPHPAPFTYLQNGRDWPNRYLRCGGGSQSPINLVNGPTVKPYPADAPPALQWANSNPRYLKAHHNEAFHHGFKYEVELGEDAPIFMANTDIGACGYQPVQFHFHANSEHTLNGKHFDGEMHIVSANTDAGSGDYIVVGFFIEVVTAIDPSGLEGNQFFAPFAPLDLHDGEDMEVPVIDFAKLDITGQKFWNYQGSLTTPPCTEVVTWYVREEPLRVSPDFFNPMSQMLKDLAGNNNNGNYRATQNLNGRTVFQATAQ